MTSQRPASRRRRPTSSRPTVEALEGRRLLAASFLGAYGVRLASANDNGTRDVAIDAAGNTFVTGAFKGTVDFDITHNVPGDTLTATAGTRDIFVAKYDPSGTLLWVRKGSSVLDNEGQSIAVDGAGNAYVTGFFGGSIDLDQDGTPDLSSPVTDIFVWKLTPGGGLGYAVQANRPIPGGQTQFPLDTSPAIAVDNTGNAYITGQFYQTIEFPTGGAPLTLTTSNPSDITRSDVFVARLNPAGQFTLARQFAGSAANQVSEGRGIAVDGAGNIYTTGNFRGTVDFAPGASVPGDTLSAGAGQAAFLAKLDASGNLGYARAITSNAYVFGQGIAVTSAGDAYATGVFAGTADLDPNGGTSTATRTGNLVGQYLVKLNPSGGTSWTRDLGTSDDPFVGIGNMGLGDADVALDNAGNVYVGGGFVGVASFDVNSTRLLSFKKDGGGESEDVFVAKYGSGGNVLDVARLGGPNDDLFQGLAVAPDGTTTVTGGYVNRLFAAGGYTLPRTDVPGYVSGFYNARLKLGQAPAGAPLADFDGNGVTDLGLYTLNPPQQSDPNWNIRLKNANGGTIGSRGQQYGFPGQLVDIPITGDYDGNGVVDFGLFRTTTSEWVAQLKGPDGSVVRTLPDKNGVLRAFLPRNGWGAGDPNPYPIFGAPNLADLPVPGDYDGNGVTDLALFRVATAEWIITLQGTDGRPIGSRIVQVGTPGNLNDLPVPGDYDGNGVTDFAVYRVSDGTWYIQFKDASGGDIAAATAGGVARFARAVPLGSAANPPSSLRTIPAPGDYDGNGVVDPAIFNVDNGQWSIRLSNANGSQIGVNRTETFGAPNFVQVPLNAPYPALIRLGVLSAGSGTSTAHNLAAAGGATRGLATAAQSVSIPVILGSGLDNDLDTLLTDGPLGRRKTDRGTS